MKPDPQAMMTMDRTRPARVLCLVVLSAVLACLACPAWAGLEFEYFRKGESLVNQGKLREATAAFKRAIEIKPNDATLHNWLGSVYFDLGEYPAAAEHLKKASLLGETWSYYLGMSLFKINDLDGASKVLSEGAPKEKKADRRKLMEDTAQKIAGFKSRYQSGSEKQARGQYAEAERDLEEAVKLVNVPAAVQKLSEVRQKLSESRASQTGQVRVVLIAGSAAASAILLFLVLRWRAWARGKRRKKALACIARGDHEGARRAVSSYISSGGRLTDFGVDELLALYPGTTDLTWLLEQPLSPDAYGKIFGRLSDARSCGAAEKALRKYIGSGGDLKTLRGGDLLVVFAGMDRLRDLGRMGLSTRQALEAADRLVKARRNKDAVILMKDTALLDKAASGGESVGEILELYDRCGELEPAVRESASGARAPLKAIVEALVGMKREEIALEALKTRFQGATLSSGECTIYVSLMKKRNRVTELDPSKFSYPQRLEILEGMAQKGMGEQVLKALNEKPRIGWAAPEWRLAFSVCQEMDLFEVGEKIFGEVRAASGLQDKQELHYDFARFCEDSGRPERAAAIYKEFADKSLFFGDVLERQRRLQGDPQGASPGPRRRMGRETLPPEAGGRAEEESNLHRKYEVMREIGRGGMGIVFEGRDRKLGKRVAIKQMREELRINPKEKKKFLETARLVADLHHPFIVDIYEIVEDGPEVYLVFEYVDGWTVEQVLGDKGRLSMRETLRILVDVTKALEYAHSKRVVHRDLKPSNIIVAGDGYAKVMDFGIARVVKETVSRVSGRETSGALGYMAPEQHLGRSDARADVFSLGATLYEMLTGEMAFPGPDFLAQKERMVYRPMGEMVEGMSEGAAAVVAKCLRCDPGERYASVKDLWHDLEGLRDGT